MRLDQYLVQEGLFPTREKARKHIMAGLVMVNEQRIDKPGHFIKSPVQIRLKALSPYVSRGGEKLASVASIFAFPIQDQVFLDLGASTGGFTDYLLQNGARLVFAVDVGTNQLDFRLRQDNRVISLEKTHIRDLKPEILKPCPNGAVLDLSFISLKQVLPFCPALFPGPHFLIALFKPQFEVGREGVGKGGIVRDHLLVEHTLSTFLAFCEQTGYGIEGLEFSRLAGTEGNFEYFVYLKWPLQQKALLSELVCQVMQNRKLWFESSLA